MVDRTPSPDPVSEAREALRQAIVAADLGSSMMLPPAADVIAELERRGFRLSPAGPEEPREGLDVEALARAMAAETGVAWPKSWRDSDFAWVARQVGARYGGDVSRTTGSLHSMEPRVTGPRGEPLPIDLDVIEMRWASQWNESDDGEVRAWRADVAALIDEVHRLHRVSNGYFEEMVRRTPDSGAEERAREDDPEAMGTPDGHPLGTCWNCGAKPVDTGAEERLRVALEVADRLAAAVTSWKRGATVEALAVEYNRVRHRPLSGSSVDEEARNG